MIELTFEMLNAYSTAASQAQGVSIEASASGLRAVLNIVERDHLAKPADPPPLPLSVGRIQAYCGRAERPHGGHVWNTSVDRWCPGDEVPGRPEPRLPDTRRFHEASCVCAAGRPDRRCIPTAAPYPSTSEGGDPQ